MSELADRESEERCIGSCFLRPEILDWIDLEPKHFTVPLYRLIFATMRDLRENGSDPQLDLLPAMRRTGASVAISEIEGIAANTPTPDNAEFYAGRIRDKESARAISSRLSEVQQAIKAGADGEELLALVSERIATITATDSEAQTITGDQIIRDRLREIFADMRERESGGASRRSIPTGIRGLDQAITGIPIGKPSVISARPGSGKTTLLTNVLINMAESGVPVAMFSYEDRAPDIGDVMLARAARVNRRHVRDATLDAREVAKVTAAAERYRGLNNFHLIHAHGKSMRETCRIARVLARREGVKAIALDYIQNVANPSPGMRRHDGIEENLRIFETVLAQDGLAGIVASQLKRRDDERFPPNLKDLKDSGSIEQKAKIVLALHAGKVDQGGSVYDHDENNTVDLYVLKFNAGAARCRVRLPFEWSTGKVGESGRG